MASGGYQPPANPAPVSGPGALSKRTDGVPAGQVTGLGYGQNSAVNDMARQGPMAQPTGPNITPLDAPTQFPAEPVTSGVPIGPGPGPSAMQMQAGSLTDRIARLMGDDVSGEIESLYLWAERYGL